MDAPEVPNINVKFVPDRLNVKCEHAKDSLEEKFLLAQYQGLKQEIQSRINSLFQIISFTLLAFGVILTVAYHDGQSALLLLYTFVAFFAAIVHINNKQAIYKLGEYIRNNTEKQIPQFRSSVEIPEENRNWWETYVSLNLTAYKFLRASAGLLLFVGTQVLALVCFIWFPPHTPDNFGPRSFCLFTRPLFDFSLIIVLITLVSLFLLDDMWSLRKKFFKRND